MGWQPNGYGATLGWAGTINNVIHPTNVVYTTHFYYYAPSDLSSYWAKDYATLKTQVQTGINGMGVSAPLVINEEGSCLSSSPNKQNDYTWWQNLLLAQRDLGVGAGAYYWVSDSGLGGVYSGESLLTSGYSPNTMGVSFINAYSGSPTPTATPAPSPAPTGTNGATCAADLNCDGKVDFNDIKALVADYLAYCSPNRTYTRVADFNLDGKINFQDIQLFVTYYVTFAQRITP
jgi:hypothetical protein